MTTWTSEQELAINATGDILVSAGAGSGKTAVLTQRIVRLVREGLDVRALLCVTFTIAAANEMKKRIERALYQAATASDNDSEAARLNEAARGCSSAAISTLHAFCNQVLRRHFNEVGLDPAFRVADESEILIMREAVWDELCESRLSESGDGFARFLDAMGSDDAAFGAVCKLFDFCRSQPDPFAFLDMAQGKYTVTAEELMNSPEAQELIAQTRRNILYKAGALAAHRDALAAEHPVAAAFIDQEILTARKIAMQKTTRDLQEALAAMLQAPKARISWKGCPDALKTAADKARTTLKDALKAQAKVWLRGMDGEVRLILRQAPLIAELCKSVRFFSDKFSALKRDKSVIDYGDMEQFTLALLQNEEIANEYRRRFRFVFMDEYQDCNAVQEEILRRIINPGSLFLVGDVKQSIYRFRLAEPALFVNRYDRYADAAQGRRIDLNANFRSAQGVIDAVNSVFSRLMRADSTELDYDVKAQLVHKRDEPTKAAPGPCAEFIFADMLGDFLEEEENQQDEAVQDDAVQDEDDAEPAPSEPRSAVQVEAALAAKRIREIMETETLFDPHTGSMRKPRYSDFTVLLRSYKNVSEDWLATLSLAGIPAYGERSGGFFDAVEVRVFMELLRVIDNRQQDIPLAAVLRSTVGGFSTEDLIELRTVYAPPRDTHTRWHCYDSLEKAALCDTQLGQRAKEFIQRLSRWQRMANLMSVQSLIGKLLDETDYALFCRALPGGRQREANLDALCEKARLFESTGSAGLHAFLTYTDKLRNVGASGTPQIAGLDVVRVMSIHASKGLEFPYVLLAGLSHEFNTEDTRKPLVLDPALGLAVRFNLAGIRTKSFYANAITARCNSKGIAEESRVLYVAMTRARERLVLLCATTHGNRLIQKAALEQDAASIALEKSFAGWLLGCILHAKEGEGLRARYGLPPLPDAPSIGITVTAQICTADSAVDARMSLDAYERFRQQACLLPADTQLFERAYSFCHDTLLPSKVSVTGLAGHEIKMTEAPDFLLAARMTPADRGTAYHALMHRILLRAHDAASIGAELERLCDEGLLSELQAQAVCADEVAAFFRSTLGARLIAAQTVRRELEFNISMSAKSLGLGESDAPVILQGVIDCCFLENGAWVLIDYKTDNLPPGTRADAAAVKHAHQLNLYANALEKLTGTPVSERAIYFFTLREAQSYRKATDHDAADHS